MVEIKKKEEEASTSEATAGAWYHYRSAQKVTLKKHNKNISISYNRTDLPE